MAQWVIPTSTDPLYTQTSALDGVEYTLSFAFNGREKCWYLSIGTAAGVPIVSGLKIMANTYLLQRYTDDRLPPGELIAFTTSTDDSPPGLEELGAGLRCELLYLDAAELAEMAG